MDVASLGVMGTGNENLQITISNGYPGYQAAVTASVTNVSGAAVDIIGVRVIPESVEPLDSLEHIILSLTNSAHGDLLGASYPFVLDRGASMDVKIINRVRQIARQNETYNFEIIIEARQARSPGPGPDDPDPRPEPAEPTEPLIVPEDPAVKELPFTGDNAPLFAFAGMLLGALGILARRVIKK